MVDRPSHPDSVADRKPVSRTERHREIQAELQGSTDEALVRLLSDLQLLERGHTALTLPRSGATVFVKLVPLTALELEPENHGSTANIFELPTYYQYRLGGCGLGAWRELEVHRVANEWVLSGQCEQFPLLHSWRALPVVSQSRGDKHDTGIWGPNPAIQRRVAAIAEATSSVVLFLEYFPLTLLDWLRGRLTKSADCMTLVRETEASLLALLAFLKGQGVLHMDAHFENVLTDGTQLVLGDHELAISRAFRLDDDELEFFANHESFDRCTVITSLVHAVVTSYDTSEDWRGTLRAMTEGSHPLTEALPAGIREYLSHRGPVARAIGDFYRRLLNDLTTEYPCSSLERLCD